MYSSLLIRPPHKHDKTAIASLCGQDLFLIKGVKRWHCIKNITVSSLIVQTQVFFHDCIMKRWVLITIRLDIFSFLGLFFSQHFTSREKIHVKCYHELMNVFNSWVKWKGVMYILLTRFEWKITRSFDMNFIHPERYGVCISW